MTDTFYTIEEYHKIEFKEKNSLFIAEIFPIQTREQFTEIYQSLKKKYYDATHITYCWVLGLNANLFHYSDDGEPGGTAGVKIFKEIRSKNITNVLVTVTRYFGGIKLGVGPLGKAYSTAAGMVINESKIIKKYVTKKFLLHLTYDEYNRIQKPLRNFVISILDTIFTDSVKILFEVQLSKETELKNFLISALNGKVELKEVD